MGAKVLAQTSIVDGLREERKLWGQELAHQGASLARERGRLESQVDALGAENTSLREELQKERDAVRIKEKQLEDCAHTVQQLRKAMADSERGREEKHREIQELKRRLEHEGASFTEMQVCHYIYSLFIICILVMVLMFVSVLFIELIMN